MQSTNPHRHSAPPSSGRDELNLIDFPISVLQYQQPTDSHGNRPDELVCTIESFDRHLNQVVPRKLTRRTASKHGFPTPLEEEVLIALLTLTRLKNEFTSPRIEFRNSELFELMGWPSNGNSTKRLSIALDRLKGLTLKYEKAWATGGNRYEKEFTTGLLDSYQFVVQTAGSGDEPKAQSWIQWASEVFADIQQGNVKELNTDRYFSLDLPIARRLYRFLDKHLAETPRFEMELLTFAAHLGISGTTHIGKIKERLSPGIKAIEMMGDFIKPLDRAERYTKQRAGVWLAHFERTGNVEARQSNSRSIKPKASKFSDVDAKALVSDFYSAWSGDDGHFVTKHEIFQSQAIIKRYGKEQCDLLLPHLIKTMKRQFPEARAFGAANNYWHDAVKLHQKQNQSTARNDRFLDKTLDIDAKKEADRKRFETLRLKWESLSEVDRECIREKVSLRCSETVARFIEQKRHQDPLVIRACFDEMSRSMSG